MMFKKENFEYDGMYLMYNLKPGQHYGNNEFVARFKYVKFAGAFKNFLIKHFTTDEYFGMTKFLTRYVVTTPVLFVNIISTGNAPASLLLVI